MASPILLQIDKEMKEFEQELKSFKSAVEYITNAKESVKLAIEAVKSTETNFEARIKELKNTCESFTSLTNSVNGIISKIDSIDFPKRLANIESTVGETIQSLHAIKESTIQEVKKASIAIVEADFSGKFGALQSLIGLSVDETKQLTEVFKTLNLAAELDNFQKNVTEQIAIGYKEVEFNTNKIAVSASQVISDLDLPGSLENFEKGVNKRIHESFKEVEKNTRKIADEISKAVLDLNLPIRIDKLDANISVTSLAVQNIQGRLDKVENNLKDRIKGITDVQKQILIPIRSIEENQKQMLDLIRSAEEVFAQKTKQIQIFQYAMAGLMVILFAILFFGK